MRIAQVAPLTEAVPPKLYGGTERVVHWLTEELVALGHDVTLFASGNSQTSAKLDATWPKALRLDGAVRDPNALHMVMLERVRQKCDDEEFDFLHFHLDYYPFSLFSRQPTPFLTTLARQARPAGAPAGVHHLLFHAGDFDLERAAAPGAAGQLGAHHPSRPSRKAADAATGDPQLSRRARPHRAGKGRRPRHQDRDPMRHPAQDRGEGRSRRPGLLRRTHSPADREHPLVEYIGEIGDHEKSDFLSGAIGLLVPIDWPEPFGLVMIEAMACGTPVIAYNRGSVAEIIDEGLTGFVVEDETSAVARRRPARRL